MLWLQYQWNHTHSPPNLVWMSSDDLANHLPSLIAVTLTQASNEHHKETHVWRSNPTVSKSRSLLRTLTHEARYSSSLYIHIPNLKIWLGRDSCPNIPKQVNKHQFLACKPRLQLGEMLWLQYQWNHTHSPPNLVWMSSDDLANHLPSLIAVTLTQASNEHHKETHVSRSNPTVSKSRSLLCTLTHEARNSSSFHLHASNFEIWSGSDSCPNIPKQVHQN